MWFLVGLEDHVAAGCYPGNPRLQASQSLATSFLSMDGI